MQSTRIKTFSSSEKLTKSIVSVSSHKQGYRNIINNNIPVIHKNIQKDNGNWLLSSINDPLYIGKRSFSSCQRHTFRPCFTTNNLDYSQKPVYAMDIPKTQTAAVFHKHNGPVDMEKVPVTQPDQLKPGQALVKVIKSGVCHTDYHALAGDWPLPSKLPCIGGHEGAGDIVAIGANTSTDLKVGDRVGIKWIAHSCLNCGFCKQGYEPLCPEAECSGFSVDGSFQQYAVSFTSQLTRIPDNMSYEDAAPILCAGVTVYKAIKESEVKPGQTIALPGAGGGLGHLAVQYAKYMGLKVIAIDTGAEKKALCEKLGAEKWIDFKDTKDIVKSIKDATDDKLGPHAAIVTAATGKSYEQAMEYIRPHGTVVAVGLPPGAKIQADVFWTVFQSKRLVGSYVGNRQDADEALRIAADGHVKTMYKVQPFSTLPDVYKKMHDGTLTGRVVLDLWK